MKAQNIPESSLQVFDDILMEALYENDENIAKLFKELDFEEIAELCKACARIIGIMIREYSKPIAKE